MDVSANKGVGDGACVNGHDAYGIGDGARVSGDGAYGIGDDAT